MPSIHAMCALARDSSVYQGTSMPTMPESSVLLLEESVHENQLGCNALRGIHSEAF